MNKKDLNISKAYYKTQVHYLEVLKDNSRHMQPEIRAAIKASLNVMNGLLRGTERQIIEQTQESKEE